MKRHNAESDPKASRRGRKRLAIGLAVAGLLAALGAVWGWQAWKPVRAVKPAVAAIRTAKVQQGRVACSQACRCRHPHGESSARQGGTHDPPDRCYSRRTLRRLDGAAVARQPRGRWLERKHRRADIPDLLDIGNLRQRHHEFIHNDHSLDRFSRQRERNQHGIHERRGRWLRASERWWGWWRRS